MTAQKQLGKTLIYKMKNNRAFVTGYGRPGSKNPFTPSANQIAKRNFYIEAVAVWQGLTESQKDYWSEEVKSKNLNMSGFNLFYQQAFNDPIGTLGFSYHGQREYGYYMYGDEPEI
jgi:hypothetical protein